MLIRFGAVTVLAQPNDAAPAPQNCNCITIFDSFLTATSIIEKQKKKTFSTIMLTSVLVRKVYCTYLLFKKLEFAYFADKFSRKKLNIRG
jgi:hypothetical protein